MAFHFVLLFLAFMGFFGGGGTRGGLVLANGTGTAITSSSWLGWNVSSVVGTSLSVSASTPCENSTGITSSFSTATSAANTTVTSTPATTSTPCEDSTGITSSFSTATGAANTTVISTSATLNSSSTSTFPSYDPGCNSSTSATLGINATASTTPWLNSTSATPTYGSSIVNGTAMTVHLLPSYLTKTVYQKASSSTSAPGESDGTTTVYETDVTTVFAGTATITSARSMVSAQQVASSSLSADSITGAPSSTIAVLIAISSSKASVCSQLSFCTDMATIKGSATKITYVCDSTAEVSALAQPSTVYTTVTDFTTTFPVSTATLSQGSSQALPSDSSSSSDSAQTVTEYHSITQYKTHTVYATVPANTSASTQSASGIFYTPHGSNSSAPSPTGYGSPIKRQYLADEFEMYNGEDTTIVTVFQTTTLVVTVSADQSVAEGTMPCEVTSTTTKTVCLSSGTVNTENAATDLSTTGSSQLRSTPTSISSANPMSTAGTSSSYLSSGSPSVAVTETAAMSSQHPTGTGYNYPGASTLAMGTQGAAVSGTQTMRWVLLIVVLALNALVTV